jgi:putative flippase GtrA
MVRWWLVGLAFSGVSLPLLYAFHDLLSLALPVASLIAGELGTLLRFVVNDRWVFGNSAPTWKRFWRYHAAVASSFGIWWLVTNVLPGWGISYLLASIAGTACSVGWSMVTNFLWIWRTRRADSFT